MEIAQYFHDSKAVITERRILPASKELSSEKLWIGRQIIPLRGHRDRGRLFSNDNTNDGDVLNNEGNFSELIRFRVENGDKLLKKNLENSKAPATRISSRIKNEIIEYCGEEILDIVLSRIRQTSDLEN
ncbi:unnamed protein product [Acanthoscelides obtectus]|uniref:Uncharacterized protein n=1 Tax=Acanthoscelides obtectus TaxID=200917 RepID=A0A9P0PWI7_ACAOB|nr:unnamed protein product [Acanthoscelides obtectus]CAK1648533.1 hypothetical protein AOBTE_LOCUS15748 [Acanthoscelides obtectus]